MAAEHEMRSIANVVEVIAVTHFQANAYPLVGVPDETLLAAIFGQSSL